MDIENRRATIMGPILEEGRFERVGTVRTLTDLKEASWHSGELRKARSCHRGWRPGDEQWSCPSADRSWGENSSVLLVIQIV